MQLTHLSPTATQDEIFAILERDGVVILDELVTPDIMDQVGAELRPWYDRMTPGHGGEGSGAQTVRIGALAARSPVSARELILHPVVLAAARKLLYHATTIQLHVSKQISLFPGEDTQVIHRDQYGCDAYPFHIGREVICACMWAQTDFTAANGATRVIPGSHLYEPGLQFQLKDTIPAEMKKGSVLIYTGSLYHGGGANATNEVRSGIKLDYSVAWLRQEENQYLSIPIEVARTMPLELQRLIGYARGGFALGYVDDLRDPISLLRPDMGVSGFGDEMATSKKLQPLS
jgi:ectoine hydroxylase-related dioxygenase (phytanoyl-CoA dioxygenase family)